MIRMVIMTSVILLMTIILSHKDDFFSALLKIDYVFIFTALRMIDMNVDLLGIFV